MPSFRKQKALLNQYIDTLHDFETIALISSKLNFPNTKSVEALKTVIKNELNHLDEKETRKIFYNSMPIDSILPIDVIQTALSFDQSIDADLVCKIFKECNAKNQAYRERERIVAANEYKFKPIIKYDASTNKTRIVRNDGSLDEEDSYIRNAITNCNSGDILLVEGQHEDESGDLNIFGKAIQIIGKGDNAQFKFEEIQIKECNLYFKNIQIQTYIIDIWSNTSVWMENCTLKCTINLEEDSNLYLKSCTSIISWPSLYIDPFSNDVRVIGCRFIEHGVHHKRSCILIKNAEYYLSYEEKKEKEDKISVSLECIGNLFKSKEGDSMAEYDIHKGDQIEMLLDVKRIFLKKNLLNGCNADCFKLFNEDSEL